MEKEKPYQDYLDLGQKRFDIVEQAKHQEPSSIEWIKFQYPEEDFIELYGQQDKKPIKIKTYRHKVDTSYEKPKAIILFFHNLGMTALASGHLAEDLSKKGYQTVGMDLRGHGKSEGQKGMLDNVQGVVKDVQNFITKVQELYKDSPLFFLGDGVGCLILLNMVRQKVKLPFKALIFAGPSFGKPKRGSLLSSVSQFSLKLIPNKTGIFNLLFENNSRNPNAGKLMHESKLFYHDKVKVGTLTQLVKLSDKMDDKKTFTSMHLPELLVIQGQKDKSSDASNTINFYQAIPSQKQLWYYKEMWHMFLVEKEYIQIRDRLIQWLDVRTTSKQQAQTN